MILKALFTSKANNPCRDEHLEPNEPAAVLRGWAGLGVGRVLCVVAGRVGLFGIPQGFECEGDVEASARVVGFDEEAVEGGCGLGLGHQMVLSMCPELAKTMSMKAFSRTLVFLTMSSET